MSRREYQVDRDGVRKLARSSAMSKAMVAAAEEGQKAAEAKSPRGRTSNYRDGFRVEPVDVEVGGERRKGAVLKNVSDTSTLVEFGTQSRPGQHILRDHAMPAIERLNGRRR